MESAKQLYFDALVSKKIDLFSLLKAVKDRFQTPERTDALPREWEALTLDISILKSDWKSPTEFLEKSITTLTDIQASLPKNYLSDTKLQN